MRARILAPSFLILVGAVAAACSGTGGASPATSAEPTTVPSAPASVAPGASMDASGSPAAGTPVEVVGVDYAYQGVEPSYTGPTTFSFRNDGSEVHEMILVGRR